MAPSRPAISSDTRASTITSTGKDRGNTTSSVAGSLGAGVIANTSKTRRVASSNVAVSSGLKGTPMLNSASSGITSAPIASSSVIGGTPNTATEGLDGNGNGVNGGSVISWPSLPTSTLHAYAHSHRLPHVSSAFSSSLNGMILTNPGIGKNSPTMNIRRERRRQTKETLAMAVRKSFNAAAVVEGEVIVEFVYVVRAKKAGREFRHRFGSARDARR